MNVEKISAITIKVNDMTRSMHFYNRLLGTILNLEKGHVTPDWGANNFLCRRCRSVLGSYERKRIRSRKASRCSMR